LKGFTTATGRQSQLEEAKCKQFEEYDKFDCELTVSEEWDEPKFE
jgi:hypothetical protein